MKIFLISSVLLSCFTFIVARNNSQLPGKGVVVSGSVSPGFSPKECLYDVKFYFISVEADDSTANIRGNTVVDFEALADIDTLVFELTASEVVDSIVLNGNNQKNFIQEDELLKIVPETPISKGSTNQVRIRYAGTGSSAGFFAGLSNGHDYMYDKRVTYTLSEPYEAKDWFPVKQDLRIKPTPSGFSSPPVKA